MGNGDQFLRHLSLGSIFVLDELVFKVASITFKLKENMALVMSLQNSFEVRECLKRNVKSVKILQFLFHLPAAQFMLEE